MSREIILLYIEHNSGVNGLVKVLTNMANEFCNCNYKVTIVTSGSEKTLPFFLDTRVQWIKLGLSDIKYNMWDKIKREINRYFIFCDHPYRIKKAELAAAKLNILLKDRKVTSIICYDHEAILVANRLSVSKQVPIIAMMHNSPDVILGNLNKAGIKEENEVAVHQVLMPSYITPVKKLGIHHVVYIPNIVPQIAKENTTNLETCHHTIINVGRVEEVQKRQHLLIKAFAKIAGKYPDWKVKIYGQIDNNGYTKALRKLISSYHLEDRIIFCGTTKKIQECLAQADIFAFPSAYEGFGLALTEAMAMGIPAIGYRSCSAVNELIQHGENGLLCEDGIDDFATKLELLITNQELRIQMGAKAHEDMKEYAPNKIWDMWEKLICNYANIGLK